MTSVLINICLVYTKTWEYDVEWYTDMFSFLKTGFKQSVDYEVGWCLAMESETQSLIFFLHLKCIL